MSEIGVDLLTRQTHRIDKLLVTQLTNTRVHSQQSAHLPEQTE